MNITNEEINLLEACTSRDAWNKACDTIKDARRGQYPDDWWPRVKKSGMMDRILRRFGADSEIHVIPLRA